MDPGEFSQILISSSFKLLKEQWDPDGIVYFIAIIEQAPDRGTFAFKMYGSK